MTAPNYRVGELNFFFKFWKNIQFCVVFLYLISLQFFKTPEKLHISEIKSNWPVRFESKTCNFLVYSHINKLQGREFQISRNYKLQFSQKKIEKITKKSYPRNYQDLSSYIWGKVCNPWENSVNPKVKGWEIENLKEKKFNLNFLIFLKKVNKNVI